MAGDVQKSTSTLSALPPSTRSQASVISRASAAFCCGVRPSKNSMRTVGMVMSPLVSMAESGLAKRRGRNMGVDRVVPAGQRREPVCGSQVDPDLLLVPQCAFRATLNKFPQMRSAPIWDALQGANRSHSPAMARICNAAGRPKRGAARREGLVQRCLRPRRLRVHPRSAGMLNTFKP